LGREATGVARIPRRPRAASQHSATTLTYANGADGIGARKRNVENLRWALLQAIDDSFRRFGVQVDERVGEALEATKGALKAALDLRRHQSNRSHAERQRLRDAAKHLEELQIEFGHHLNERPPTGPVNYDQPAL
jgi:hypothetical protein